MKDLDEIVGCETLGGEKGRTTRRNIYLNNFIIAIGTTIFSLASLAYAAKEGIFDNSEKISYSKVFSP